MGVDRTVESQCGGSCDLDDGMDGCDVGFYVCVNLSEDEKVDSC